MTNNKVISSLLMCTLALAGCNSMSKDSASEVAAKKSLAPSAWSAQDLEKFKNIESVRFPGNPEATGYNGVVSGSFHGMAQQAGLEALKQGGTSADAAMVTALTQTTLGAGAVVSHFGIMSVVHYDAASGKVYYMNANWDTIKGDLDPKTMPTGNFAKSIFDGEPTGRSALVGGFMKGVEAMNQRFGTLPFERLFEPSIELAEQGIEWTPGLNAYINFRKKTLSRLPESKAVFTKEDGNWLEVGDVFYQKALAKTLRAVSTQGADYMYTGDWAKKLVAAVQKDGGFMTMEDLADYNVIWGEPLLSEHNGYTINANGLPSYGGANMIEAINLSKAAGIKELGHWSESPESFKRMHQLTANGGIPAIQASTPALLNALYPGLAFDPESRIDQQHAEKLWQFMEKGANLITWKDITPKHSDTVVAIDKWGNMTSVVHSINSAVFGATGIIVDGVSIGDSGAIQKDIVAAAGPGNRLPDPVEHGILFKNNEPVLAFSSMAVGLHFQTAQSLINVMDFGMTPKEALDAPAFFAPETDFSSSLPTSVARILKGEFSGEFLEKLTVPYKEISKIEARYSHGLWVGATRNPKTGELKAASHPLTNGQAVGF